MGGAPIYPAVARRPGGKKAMSGIGVFGVIADALAPFVGGSSAIAGFILGLVTIVMLTFAFVLLFTIHDIKLDSKTFFMIMLLPLGFVGLVQWWESWAVFAIVFVAAIIAFKPLGGGGGSE